VHRAKSGWQIDLPGGESFVFDRSADGWAGAESLSRWLRQSDVRFSPRALTLTMFMRLCLVDQFVHGIGGARYDQVTDQLIRRHFRTDPPHYCVTTATMYFPTAVGRSRTCVPCLKQEGHQLRHRLLGAEKTQRVREIARLPRRSSERYQLFSEMRREISTVARTHPVIINWQNRMERALQASREDEIMFDRELFYGIQSRTRLQLMIDHYRRAFEPVQSSL
jgi:hypothetical protein